MAEKLTIQIPSQGWEQLLTSRQEILAKFDVARAQARQHEIQTHHGNVGEAEIRNWLTGFLPKRYGVTSGYIVSAGLGQDQKLPHYDVIIYDRLEAPVLWIEGSQDKSPQGRSMAIPVEYVRSVIEVKSTFSSTTVGQALTHLSDLRPLMDAVDSPDDRYKLHLPPAFCCGVLFFDLKQDCKYQVSALSKMVTDRPPRGFFGGIVLRGESRGANETAKISLLHSEAKIPTTLSKSQHSLLDSWAMWGASEPGADGRFYGSTLGWAEFHFSQFGFDLIALMQGNYHPSRVSSFYGIGGSG